MTKALVIDDDKLMCSTLGKIISRLGHECAYAYTIRDGQKKLTTDSFDIVLLDVQLPDGSGLDLLPEIHKTASSPEVIIITAAGDPDGAELAIKSGAWGYTEKPFSKQDITLEITRAIEYRDAKHTLKPTALQREGIIGSSPQLSECLNLLAQAATTDATVLITGETGTGKELFARAIHENSSRSGHNIVVVDCAAIPATLIESQLFGSRKGAFTGADRDVEGLVKQAHGGTLFLDEIGELPLQFQKVFLRVLQERRFRPIGSRHEEESNFRLVAATNRNLEVMIQKDAFRSDLYFRLQSIVIKAPPLRHRQDDIKDIAMHFVSKFCERNSIGVKGFSPDFFDALCSYPWPGNVRELINAIEWALSVARGAMVLTPKHLPEQLRIYLARASIKGSGYGGKERRKNVRYPESFPKLIDIREAAVHEAEKQYLQELTEFADGDIKKACRLSGISRSPLYALLKKYGLSLRK